MSQQINLFNPIFLKQKKYFSAATMAVALTLIALGLAALYGFAYGQVWQLRAQLTRQQAESAQIAQQLEQLQREVERRKKMPALEAEIAQFTAEISRREVLWQLLERELIAWSHPVSEILRALSRQYRQEAWLTRAEFSARDLTLQGRVLYREALPAYLDRLRQEPPFRGRALIRVELYTPEAQQEGSQRHTATSGEKRSYLEFVVSTREK